MAKYQFTGPDGGNYQIEAPDNVPASEVMDFVGKQFERQAGTVADPKEQRQRPVSVGEVGADVAKSLGIGVAQGAIGVWTLPGNLEYLGRAGIDAAARGLGFEDPQLSAATALPTYSDAKGAIERHTGEFYKPQTTAGEYARTFGEFAPLAALGPGGMAARAANVAGPAIASETAGQLTEGTKYEPWARAAGGLVGGMVPTAAMRAVTPVSRDAARAGHVARLEDEGVTALTAGQKSGNRALRWAEAAAADIPGAARKAEKINTAGAEQFTRAALRRAGINASRAIPEVIDEGFRALGKQFDEVAARNSLRVDRTLQDDIAKAVREYDELVPPTQRAPIIGNLIADLRTVAKPGEGIAGDVYQSVRSRLERQRRSSGSDPQLSYALGRIRDALDDGMERSVKSIDAGRWRSVRGQYRNLLNIEKAATGAGENAALGLISPAQLRNAVRTQNRRGYARGQDDLGNLARAGEAIMRPLPQSGTAPRMAFNDLFAAGGGAATGAAFGGAPGAALGAIAGPIVKGGTARAVLSAPVQKYFSNRLLDDAINSYRSQQLNALLRVPQAASELERPRGLIGGMGPQYDEFGNPLPGSRAAEERRAR